jgi:hypothetical protein
LKVGALVVVTVVVVVEEVVVGVVPFAGATQAVPFQANPLRHTQAFEPLLIPTLLTIVVQSTELWLSVRVATRHHTTQRQRIFILNLLI